MCADQRPEGNNEMSLVFYFILFFETRTLTVPEACLFAWTSWPASSQYFQTPPPHCRVPGCTAEHSFYVSSEDPYSGSQPCAVSTLPNEPPPQPEMFVLETDVCRELLNFFTFYKLVGCK